MEKENRQEIKNWGKKKPVKIIIKTYVKEPLAS